MNVTLQVSVPDILRSMANAEGNVYFDRAIASTDSVVKATRSNDYVAIFCREYRKLDPQGDLSVVFRDQVKRGDNDQAIETALKQEVKDRVSSSTNVLRSRIDQFGVVAPNIQELENDGQILLELPGVKEHDRVRDLLKSSANLEFYETMPLGDIQMALAELDRSLAADSTRQGMTFLGNFMQLGDPRGSTVGIATSAQRVMIDSIINSDAAKRVLPLQPASGMGGKAPER